MELIHTTIRKILLQILLCLCYV